MRAAVACSWIFVATAACKGSGSDLGTSQTAHPELDGGSLGGNGAGGSDNGAGRAGEPPPPGGMTHSEPDAAPPEPDSYDSLPRFPLTLVREVPLGGPSLEAEALFVRRENIEVHARDGFHVFSLEGELGASDPGQPALGADGFYAADGAFVYALVLDRALLWFGWEVGGSLLEDIGAATGVGVGHDYQQCEGCVYVTDGVAPAVKEYRENGIFLRELSLPGIDPQGAAVDGTGRVYVADAMRGRILRLDPKLTAVEEVASLPEPLSAYEPTGLAFDLQGQLYVCFRDQNRIAVFEPGAESD